MAMDTPTDFMDDVGVSSALELLKGSAGFGDDVIDGWLEAGRRLLSDVIRFVQAVTDSGSMRTWR